MSDINYNASFLDQRRIIVCVKCFGKEPKHEQFEKIKIVLNSHHEFVYRSGEASKPSESEKYGSLPEVFGAPADIGATNKSTRSLIWANYVNEHSSLSNEWSCFQTHRAALGLLGFAWCTDKEQLIASVESYVKQKRLLSDRLMGARLFLLINTDIEAGEMSLQKATSFIAEILTQHSVFEVVKEAELITHPDDQIFLSESSGVLNNNNNNNNCGANFISNSWPEYLHPLLSQSNLTNASMPMLNHRFTHIIEELITQIASGLKMAITTRRTSSLKINPSNTETGYDMLMAPGETESTLNVTDEAKRRINKLTASNALSVFRDRPGSSNNLSAQSDAR